MCIYYLGDHDQPCFPGVADRATGRAEAAATKLKGNGRGQEAPRSVDAPGVLPTKPRVDVAQTKMNCSQLQGKGKCPCPAPFTMPWVGVQIGRKAKKKPPGPSNYP